MIAKGQLKGGSVKAPARKLTTWAKGSAVVPDTMTLAQGDGWAGKQQKLQKPGFNRAETTRNGNGYLRVLTPINIY